jgi:1,4-dihydroxy-6-naphthoate synthase
MRLTLAHSPDADDAFMFYALAGGKVDAEGLDFAHTLCDIQTLNAEAEREKYDVTAISFHAYPRVADRYRLMPAGGSMGYGYGPVVVARKGFEGKLAGRVVVSPGELTTAHLLLKLYEPEARTRTAAFDRIPELVLKGDFEAGVLIHEGQITYQDLGLVKVADLGEWWAKEATDNLPLPLGANAMRRALGDEMYRKATRVLRRSIEYALAHREEALDHALSFGRGLDRRKGDKFVGMYVNAGTLDYGSDGRKAVETLYAMAARRGLLPSRVPLDF